MRIVALSDTHTLQDQVPLPDGDILIHAGDLGNVGKPHEYIKIGKWFRDLRDKYKHRIFIAGNHDWGLMSHEQAIIGAHFDPDVIYLCDKGVELEGIKFYGTPWMPEFYDWAFMHPEDELHRYYDAIPDDTEVLITHAPPYGILDRNAGDDRCGSPTLLARVKQLPNLRHHIFGHIHGGYGTEVIDGVTFHNVSSLNEMYRYQNPPQVITIGETPDVA